MDALNFRPILKGETDIFFIKNCDKVNQAVPLLFIKLRGHTVLPFQFCKEPFYLFLFRLLLHDGISDLVQPCLRPVEPLCQPIVPRLVFRLVEGNMGVLTYALLYQFRHHIQFFLKLRLLRFQLPRTEKLPFDGLEVCGNLILFRGQDIHRL